MRACARVGLCWGCAGSRLRASTAWASRRRPRRAFSARALACFLASFSLSLVFSLSLFIRLFAALLSRSRRRLASGAPFLGSRATRRRCTKYRAADRDRKDCASLCFRQHARGWISVGSSVGGGTAGHGREPWCGRRGSGAGGCAHISPNCSGHPGDGSCINTVSS